MTGFGESRASAPGVVPNLPRTITGSTGSYHQEDGDYEEGNAVDLESREAIEKSFEVICKCFAPQDVDGGDALARAQTIESKAQARLDAFGSWRSYPHSDLEWDWAWMRDGQEMINEDDAIWQTSKLRRLLQLLRASKVYKDEAFDNELANIDENAVAELKQESNSFMEDVLKRVAFRFRYKQRWHVGKAVHILVLQRDPTVAEVLLRKRWRKVDIAHRCTNDTFGRLASVLPVHLAAGGGHPDMLKAIIELRADINAKTTLSEKDGHKPLDHYTALHEACFFQRIKAAEVLIASGANINCTNMFGETPLHLVAKLKPPLAQVLADVLVKNRADVMALNGKKLRPVDLAIDECNFPVEDMHLLTNYGLDDLVRVAKESPLAAGELMRDPLKSDDWEFKVHRRWREHLAEEAEKRPDVRDIWCKLMEDAPQAAEALLEALTSEPRVKDKFFHPLPKYAFLRSDEAFRSRYDPDHRWEYNADAPHFPDWHLGASGLAPQRRITPWMYKLIDKDVRKASIDIKVLMISNMICPEVFLQLKTTTYLHIFTKIAVRAILDHVWHQGVQIFYFAELGHKLLVIAVLLWWVVGPPLGSFGARATWSFLFAMACRELWCEFLELRGFLMVAGAGKLSMRSIECWLPYMRGIKCWLTLGNVFDFATCCLLVSLVVHLWSDRFADAESLDAVRERLAVVVLTRWLQLAGACRAFPSVGQKLIPIVQSVAGMGGILFLTVLTFSAFLHAFYALGATDVTKPQLFLDSLRFLLVGDGDGIDTVLGLGGGSAAEPSPWAVLLLVTALFLFCILLLNIFIATTDQAYEQSLEFVQTRFLQERASICFECLFRSCSPLCGSYRLSPLKLLIILLCLILPAWVGMLRVERVPLWVPSTVLAVLVAFLDALMVPIQWRDRNGKEPREDREEPSGSTEPWASKTTSISPDCASDSKSTPDMPGMVVEQPDVPSPAESAVPLPCWAQLLPASPPLGDPSQQPPPQMDAGGEEKRNCTGSRSNSGHSAPCTSKGMHLWICHREDCSEIDLWPAARCADRTPVSLEGRVSNLKREGRMRSQKAEKDMHELKQVTKAKIRALQEITTSSVNAIGAQVTRMEAQLCRIADQRSSLHGEAVRGSTGPGNFDSPGSPVRNSSDDPSMPGQQSEAWQGRSQSKYGSPDLLE